jgi:hypothetical protein
VLDTFLSLRRKASNIKLAEMTNAADYSLLIQVMIILE